MNPPFTVEYIKDGNYLRIKVNVPVTRDLADQFAAQAEEDGARLGCGGYLIDVRGVINESSVHDNFQFSVNELGDMVDEFEMKRAVLVDVDDDTHDLPILAMCEAGLNMRKFTDEQQALDWLLGG